MSKLLAHEVRGDAPASILLIHGWLTSREVWRGVADQLAAKHGVLLPDLRGFGASGGEASSDLGDSVRDLLALLDALELERVHVGGHSMGGAIAQRLAVEAPTRVASLTLVAPVPASGFHLDADTQALSTRAADDDEALEARFGFLIGNRHSPGFARATRVRCRAATTRDAYLG